MVRWTTDDNQTDQKTEDGQMFEKWCTSWQRYKPARQATKKSDILAINFRQSDDSRNSGDLRDSNWQHCDNSDNETDDSWPKWRPVSCQSVVSYNHVTTGWVISYDLVMATESSVYNPVTTTRVVSYNLVITLTDDSKLLSPSFHGLQEVANWHHHLQPTSVGGKKIIDFSIICSSN